MTEGNEPVRFLNVPTINNCGFIRKAVDHGLITIASSRPDFALPTPIQVDLEDGSKIVIARDGTAVRSRMAETDRAGYSVIGYAMLLRIWDAPGQERLGALFIPDGAPSKTVLGNP